MHPSPSCLFLGARSVVAVTIAAGFVAVTRFAKAPACHALPPRSWLAGSTNPAVCALVCVARFAAAPFDIVDGWMDGWMGGWMVDGR